MGAGTLRVLLDPPAPAAWNMSVDEALLVAAEGAWLRLYRWAPPALSLGYRQREPALAARARRAGLGLVRRATGGGAVLHGWDLTFALVLPRAEAGASPEALHARVRDALLAALRACGVSAEPAAPDPDAARAPICFARARGTEVAAAGTKLVGSAARWTPERVLEHGSIRVAAEPPALGAALGWPPLPPPPPLDRAALERALERAFAEALALEPRRAALPVAARREAEARAACRAAAPLASPDPLKRLAPARR